MFADLRKAFNFHLCLQLYETFTESILCIGMHTFKYLGLSFASRFPKMKILSVNVWFFSISKLNAINSDALSDEKNIYIQMQILMADSMTQKINHII